MPPKKKHKGAAHGEHKSASGTAGPAKSKADSGTAASEKGNKKKSASTSGDGNLLFKETHLTRESLLAYMRCVARDPACITFPAYNYPKHKSMVLKVLMSLYVGPDPKKKRKLHDNRKRPCSPSLFREATTQNFDENKSVSSGRFSERGRRKEERAGPSRRLEEYLAFVGNTYYSLPQSGNSTGDGGSSSSASSNSLAQPGWKSNSTVVSIGDLFPEQKQEVHGEESDESVTRRKTKNKERKYSKSILHKNATDGSKSKDTDRSLIPGCDEIPGLTLQRQTTLGILKNPARPRQILDEWAPKQVALFESAICIYGKNFHAIQKVIGNKSLKQVIEFYYLWKKSSHYTIWKRHFEE